MAARCQECAPLAWPDTASLAAASSLQGELLVMCSYHSCAVVCITPAEGMSPEASHKPKTSLHLALTLVLSADYKLSCNTWTGCG